MATQWLTLDDLNAPFDTWRAEIANPRVHATTGRVVDEAFAEERRALRPLPSHPDSAVLMIKRRVTTDGMICVGGNHSSVPDTTRHRTLEVQHHMTELLIFEGGALIARHPVVDGKNQRRVDLAHRRAPPIRAPKPPAPLGVGRRPLDFYGAVGRRLAAGATS